MKPTLLAVLERRSQASPSALASVRFQGAGFDILREGPLDEFHVRRVVPHVVSEAAFTKPEAMQLLADISKLADVEGR